MKKLAEKCRDMAVAAWIRLALAYHECKTKPSFRALCSFVKLLSQVLLTVLAERFINCILSLMG